ncbi:MAG: hypothetical protein JJ975_08490 [Bacteroidia bacterium]|nr:hypothetical protein [Bacteroidia bacterium]
MRIILTLFLLGILSRGYGQITTTMNDSIEYPENTHINAKELMKEAFYWSPIEESSPFGSDDGADALMMFEEWHGSNSGEPSMVFLEEIIEEWGTQSFDHNIDDSTGIEELLKTVGFDDVLSTDNLIIAVGFAQFVLEGRIDGDIQKVTTSAIKRELNPLMLDPWENHKQKRGTQLSKMLEVVNQMNM